MRRYLVLAFAATVLAVSLSSPRAEAAQRACKNTFGGDVISAKDMSCHKARVVVRAWAHKYKRDGIIDRRARGFDCRGRNDSVEGLVVSCASDGRRVTFYANVP